MKYWRFGDVFTPVPTCAWCRSDLVDSAGNPRWDVIGPITYVCYEGCRAPQIHHQQTRGPRMVGRIRAAA